MNKYNKKELIIILIITVLILLLLAIVYYIGIKPKIYNNDNTSTTVNFINHDNDNLFIYNDKAYKIPNKYEFVKKEDLLIVYPTNKSWQMNVEVNKLNKYNSINEIYNHEIEVYNLDKIKIYLKNILNNEFIIYDYLQNKTIIMCYITPWDNNIYYRFVLTYKTDTFDLNELIPVIDSLSNPITIKK